MKGAGGTQGGTGQFFMGLAMMCGGFYLLFNAIQVSSSFGLGYGLYRVNAFGQGMSITTGMVMLPFIIGIVMVFFDAKSKLAWLLSLGSLTALVVGVISSIQFHFKSMSATYRDPRFGLWWFRVVFTLTERRANKRYTSEITTRLLITRLLTTSR